MAKCSVKDVESIVLELTPSEATLISFLIALTGDSNRINKALLDCGISYYSNDYWTVSNLDSNNHIQVKSKRDNA
jgi:hypothetical protein